MLLALIFIVGLGVSLSEGTPFSDYVPVILDVLESSHSARITVDSALVPAGTDRVQIQAEEVNDLTGNRWEVGYEFGYSATVPYFYYPQLNEAKFHVFKLKYGKSRSDHGVDWSQYSAQTGYAHSVSSRFQLMNMGRTWATARDACLTQQMRLAVITNTNLNEMVLYLLKTNGIEAAWIGLYDEHYNDDNLDTTWRWVGGTHYKYNNFEPGALVKKSTVSSSTVAINSEGEWETGSPNDKLPFICEKGVTEHAKLAEASVGIQERVAMEQE